MCATGWMPLMLDLPTRRMQQLKRTAHRRRASHYRRPKTSEESRPQETGVSRQLIEAPRETAGSSDAAHQAGPVRTLITSPILTDRLRRLTKNSHGTTPRRPIPVNFSRAGAEAPATSLSAPIDSAPTRLVQSHAVAFRTNRCALRYPRSYVPANAAS